MKKDMKRNMKSCSLCMLMGLLGLFGSLSGCASHFDCSAKGTGMCASMGQVNRLADEGYFNRTTSSSIPSSATHSTSTETTSFNSPYVLNTPNPGQPIRYGESVQRIWVAPYVDAQDNYHNPSYIDTVVKPPQWGDIPDDSVVSEGG